MPVYKKKSISDQKSLLAVILFFITQFISSSFSLSAQCNGVSSPKATLSIVERPCGPKASGIITLEIKDGKAPYKLTWTKDNQSLIGAPSILNTQQLTIENLEGAMKPGYVVQITDACQNKTSATALQLVNAVPIQFVNAPIISQQVSSKDEPNGKLLVELRGGNPPRTLVATDSKGKSFVQQFPVGPADKGIFKYELDKLPAEKYKIELKSGSEKCTQVWKETIELRAVEK